MKKILALLFCCGFCAALPATESKISEPELWNVLRSGDFSLSHKMVLARKIENTNDAIMSQFMMAYSFYKNGQTDEMMNCLEGIDNYLEHYYEQR